MINKEFFLALNQLENEGKIDKKLTLQALETAIAQAYKKEFGEGRDIAVQINEERNVIRIVAYKTVVEEVENTEWLPGVIVLVPAGVRVDDRLFDAPVLLEEVPQEVLALLPTFTPYLCYPFDFTGMKPVGGTRHTQLR